MADYSNLATALPGILHVRPEHRSLPESRSVGVHVTGAEGCARSGVHKQEFSQQERPLGPETNLDKPADWKRKRKKKRTD